MLSRPAFWVTSLALLAAPQAASAEEEPAKLKDRMRNFFDAGAEAFKAGQYLAAAEAFEKANALVASPALLFSAAQAYRRQYLVEPSPVTLRKALSLYREYLSADPKAKRREDAMEALAVLVPLETRAGEHPPDSNPAPQTAGNAPPQDQKRTARILITTGAEGAEISLDGGAFQPAPLVASVEPGAHRARVRAPGHDEEEVTVPAVAHEQVPQHVTLRPKPGRLDITGTSGARIHVDGKPLGTVPVKSLSTPPGQRFVTVMMNGHEPWAREIFVEKDRTTELSADLRWTQQRKIAWATISVGIAGALSTAVVSGLALDRQNSALALRDKQAAAPLSIDERERYNLAVRERNDFGQAAAITGAVSALILGTGVGLYAFDEPQAPASDSDTKTPHKPSPITTFEVGLGSASLRVTF